MAELSLTDLTVNVNVVDREDYVVACLESLLKTTPAGPRLNVLFNGSRPGLIDRTSALLEQWSGPSSTIVLDSTEPLWKSHQIALDAVETTLANFMGDDDIILEPRLQDIVDGFNEITPTPGAITTFAKRIGPSLDPVRIGSNKDLGPVTVEEWRRLSERGAMFEMNFSGAVFRTESVRRAGGLPKSSPRPQTIVSLPSLLRPSLSWRYLDDPSGTESTRTQYPVRAFSVKLRPYDM